MICQKCDNLIEYVFGNNVYVFGNNVHGYECKYGLPSRNYIKCSHFKEKVI